MTPQPNYFHPAEKEAYTLRLLLSFIAKDLGIEDTTKEKHKIALTREIRAAIARLKFDDGGNESL